MISFLFSWYPLVYAILLNIHAYEINDKKVIFDCRAKPAFIDQIKGIDGSRAAISTTELRMGGLVLVELEYPQFPNSKRIHSYQHESWKMAGNVGPFVIDHLGNIFIVPSPKVNVLENPIKDQNTIYEVNSNTGIMKPLISLPYDTSKISGNFINPFGLIGISFDCDDYTLFASSVLGSTPEKENGMIYHLNPYTKEVISVKKDIDAFGLISFQMGTEKRLLYGLARTGDVYSMLINNKGKFIGEVRKEFSIEGKGERGDDKVRKFKITREGDLEVYGLQFYYNLTAPTEKQESKYVFRYDAAIQKWTEVK
ncbi:MAG TPA: hypothetical protein VK590_12880 [Saprospiraceae bacterium]|nr:hypothetical protein [Saprospiraceae bacterium]